MKKSAQLTKEQLKKSISAKQSKVKLKNVLASPYPSYWPLLQNNSVQTLRNILQTILPDKHPDHDRRVNVDRNYMLYGLSSVHRSLKAGRVDSLLLSTSIEPRFVLQQIIQHAFAKRRNLKVICVENLENILKDVRIESIALGLIRQDESNPYRSLHDFIAKESARFEIPGNYFQDPPIAKNKQKTGRKKPKSLMPAKFQADTVYLCKDHYSSARVFIPESPQKVNSPQSSQMSEEGDNSTSEEEIPKPPSLINLSISSKSIRKLKKTAEKSKKLKKKTTSYLPLIINRIAPNPSKQKKKVKKSKRGK